MNTRYHRLGVRSALSQPSSLPSKIMKLCRTHTASIACSLLLPTLIATSSAAAQKAALAPPVRQLGARLAITRDTLGSVAGIRAMSDGRVLVNDVLAQRLVLFDSTLRHATVVA